MALKHKPAGDTQMNVIDAGRVRIVVSSATVGADQFVDLRAFKPTSQGRLAPTSSGLLIPAERIQHVIKALQDELDALAHQPKPAFFYFVEALADRRASRTVLHSKTSATLAEARSKTPEDYGSDANEGYLFKAVDYVCHCTYYVCAPTRPSAVWDPLRSKWLKFDALSKK